MSKDIITVVSEELIQDRIEDFKSGKMVKVTVWHYQKNEHGQEFWDTYLHQECRSMYNELLPVGETPYE